MKLAAGLFALASASQREWVINQWWTEANNMYDFAVANSAQFQAAVDSAPDAIFEPLWGFCNGGDGAVSGNELAGCGQKIGNFLGVSGDNQSFLYQFGEKYWGIVDQDGNGSLDFGEFKSAIAALAGSNARVAMKGFDADGDNMLNSAEQTAFYNKVIAIAQSWGYNVTDAQWAALKAAYAQAAAGKSSLSTFDVAVFEILAGNVFLN